jgi:metal-responsive CopG/Arc/MetJ family transcriptional regulator
MSNTRVVGVSLRHDLLEQLDQLAARDGLSRSGKVAALIERDASRSSVPDVRVDGRRFVPARGKR